MILFGTTGDGQPVHAITLTNEDLSATILTYGAILQDVRLAGVPYSLTLGSDTLSDYEDVMAFHGSLVGPVANRISGAETSIAGQTFTFEKNLNQRHTLHSGSGGTQAKVWQVEECSPKMLILSVILPNGEAGFPGARHVTAHFSIDDTNGLILSVTTKTDAPSILNFTNHSYWNLDGSPSFSGHKINVAADRYLPSTDEFLPTGEIVPVAGTAFDFNRAKALQPGNPPLDNTFCVANERRALTEVTALEGQSGIRMTVATTEAGLHLFDARSAQRPNGPFYEGIAIEAQNWPDASNHAHFPSLDVTPDAPVTQTTRWRFSR